MSNDTAQSRTETATPRRRQEARKKGQVAFSPDLSTAALLLCAVLTLWQAGDAVGVGLSRSVSEAVSMPATDGWSPAEASILARWVAGRMLETVGWLAAAFALYSIGAAALQGGVTFTTQPLEVDWERLSPARNWKKLVSWSGAAKGLLATAKVAAILGCFCWFVHSSASSLRVSGRRHLAGAVETGWTFAMSVFGAAATALLALALIDLLVQRFRHEHGLRMTREELKQEQKEDEGDPHQRAHVRKLQREQAQLRGLADVPEATVVVTNPTHIAVALRYERDSSAAAPLVLAKGSGAIARRIVRAARNHGVPVIERKPLARLLFRVVDVGQEIPVELYRAVAEILTHVYRVAPGGGMTTA